MKTKLYRVISLVLWMNIAISAISQPIENTLFNQKSVDQNQLQFFPVHNFDIAQGKVGTFLTDRDFQEGYVLDLEPGEATLIFSSPAQQVSNTPVVITLDYAVLKGQARVAVIGLNAIDGNADGQLGYCQRDIAVHLPKQQMHVVYAPPSQSLIAATQVSLDANAAGPATVILYGLSVHSYIPQYKEPVAIYPSGHFDEASQAYLKNVNQDQGLVDFQTESNNVRLTAQGDGRAANIGVQIQNQHIQPGLLTAAVDVARFSGQDGMSALVITDGDWNSAVFVQNQTLAENPQPLFIGGSYAVTPSQLYAFVQNGGGQETTVTVVDNLRVEQLATSSIQGLQAIQPFAVPDALAMAMLLPKEMYKGNQASLTVLSVDDNNKKPVSVPYNIVVNQSGNPISMGQGFTNNSQNAHFTMSGKMDALNPGAATVELFTFGEKILSAPITVKDGGVLFIETDKPIYKPGQKILGRVIHTNNALQPLSGEVEVSISDAKGIKIFKKNLQTNPFGIASFELPLATELNFGIWKISATVGNSSQTELDIEVDQYVLPAFEVTINQEKDWFLTDEKIVGTIDSRYFFGKPVQGNATIQASKYVAEWQEFASVTGRLTDGVFSFELPAVGYVAGTPGSEGYGTVQLNVTVTDDTGHEEKTDKILTIASSGLRLKAIPESPSIKPGLEQQLLIISETPEGIPLSVDVHLSISFVSEDGMEISQIEEKQTTENGLSLYSFTVPENTQIAFVSLSGEWERKPAEESIVLNAVYSPGAQFIHLRQRNDGIVQTGAHAIFDVFATHPGTIYYDVYANGRTLFSKTSDSTMISFPVTPEMSPSAKLVAYMIQPNSEVSVDVLPFDVELKAPVSLETAFSADEVKPGDPVSLSIYSDGEAMVGVSIVDESVFALAKGRLNLRNVFAELERLFMEPKIEIHEPDPWMPTVNFNTKGAVDLLLENNLQMVATASLVIPKATQVDPWQFWRGGMPDKFIPLFPAPEELDNTTGGGSTEYQEPDRVRSFFPETWVWEPELLTDALGRTSLQLTAPDSITTWKLHAVSTSEKGLGITENSIRVFQDFFAEPDLPYAVIRGDRFPLRVRLFNYIDTTQHIRVTLDAVDSLGLQGEPVQEIDIPANGVASVTFTLQPNKVGVLPISIVAQSALRADAIQKTLRVEPEGARRSIIQNGVIRDSEELLIHTVYPDAVPLEERYPDTPPLETIVPDSKKLRLAITPSIMGQSMSGLEDLLGMPFGCGEQNMIYLAPDVEVLRYFKHTGQVIPEIQAKAELFIQTGYQRQLTYRHQDGSFSAFGEQDETGSLWLTAFVLSTFANAREVQTIDEAILSEAASWMLSHQKADGSFESVGTVIHQEMIGGVNAGYGLTAFATLALLDYGSADATQVALAVDYLASALENEKIDSYILSLITYALMKADHPQAENALETLLEQSIVDSDGIHWEPHPVETTGYAIMALVEAERLEAQPAIEWLSTQRNAFGGFHSTQDTVVGLKALTLAAMAQGRDLDAVVDVIIDNAIVHSFTVGQDNFDVLQSLELDPVDAFTLRINGTGKVFYQVAQSYNVPVAPVQQEDQLQLTVHYDAEHIAVDDIVDVQVSVLYQGDLEKTGMSIVDISIPTGFAAVPASLDRLREWENVKRVDVAGRKVIFYFDHFTHAEPIEFTFQVKALFPVRADSGTSEAYLYYDTGVRTEATGALLQVE